MRKANIFQGVISFLSQNVFSIVIIGLAVWLFIEIRKGGLLGLLGNVVSGQAGSSEPYVPKRSGFITEQKAKSLADRLYMAMQITGTDEKEINYVYEEIAKVPGSIIDVSEAFGMRKYFITGVLFFEWLGRPLNLWGWLNEELSGKDLDKWRVLFNNAGL